MQKVGCTKCGALILPATAERNGGVCMACKAGIRKSMERSKQYYQEQRELDKTDPERLYWKALVGRVHGEGGGFNSLTAAEQKYYAAHVLLGEVCNGGFDQYFHNHSGEYYTAASAALLELGAQKTLRLLREAKVQFFGAEEVPTDTAARRQYMAKHPVSSTERVSALEKEFWSNPDSLEEMLGEYAASHKLFVLPHNNSLQGRRP